jgi:hypothetical protein
MLSQSLCSTPLGTSHLLIPICVEQDLSELQQPLREAGTPAKMLGATFPDTCRSKPEGAGKSLRMG